MMKKKFKGVDPRDADKTPEERKKTKKPAARTRDDYDDDDDAPLSDEADKGIKQCDRIRAMIEQIDRPDSKFLTDVYESVGDMSATIERINKVTERQQSALDSWEAAVEKWNHGPRQSGGRRRR